MNNLRKWLESLPRDPNDIHSKNFTHLLLNGGKINVPSIKEREFIKVYAESLRNGDKHYIVECRPNIFRYVIDVDLKVTDDQFNDEDKLKSLVKVIQEVILEFYETDKNVIVCTCPHKKITDKSGITFTKIGVHLIWPRHFISSCDALVLRVGIIQKLTEKFGERKFNSWEDVIDERIYNKNGFRMIGSDKFDRSIKNGEGRVYWPIFVMDSYGNLRNAYYNRLCKDYEALIVDTSIRMVPVSIGIPFTKIPEWVKIDDKLSDDIQSNRKSKVSRVMMGTTKFSDLEKFMKKKLPAPYKNQCLKSVERYPDGNLLIITDSSYCMNIGRCHNSCGIYFFASKKGLYQKCLCPCINMTDRIFGYCKDYTSSCFEFNTTLKNKLFPKSVLNKMSNGKYKKPNSKTGHNLSKTQTNKKFCKNLSNFCDDLFDSIE
jgi:hypothetical protein